jgi:hypothetical protein
MSFAKNHVASMNRNGVAPGAALGSSGVTTATGDVQIDEFLRQWGLDDKAQALLLSLDPDSRQKVMNGFAPPQNTRSIPACFMGFAKNIAGAGSVAAATHRASPYGQVLHSGLAGQLGGGADDATLAALGLGGIGGLGGLGDLSALGLGGAGGLANLQALQTLQTLQALSQLGAMSQLGALGQAAGLAPGVVPTAVPGVTPGVAPTDQGALLMLQQQQSLASLLVPAEQLQFQQQQQLPTLQQLPPS